MPTVPSRFSPRPSSSEFLFGPSAERAPILPAAASSPLQLLWIWVVPQVILLLWNLHAFWLVWGEMVTTQRRTAGTMVGFEVAMLLGAAGLALLGARSASRRLPYWAHLPLLGISAGFLWWLTVQTDRLIPGSVVTWILPPENLLLYQFTFVMPAAFFAALMLAALPLKIRWWEDVGLAVFTCIGALAPVWVLTQFSGWYNLPEALWVILFVLTAVAFVLGLLRLLGLLYAAARHAPRWARLLLVFLIALAAPLGGLWLNQKIPFPADFQSTGVYAATVVNGLLLCLGLNAGPAALRRWVWLAQVVSFPFTVYFFVVFLPYLPLSVPATLALGSGFLMLAPTALFFLHGSLLLDGFQAQLAGGQSRRRTALWAVAAFLTLPVLYTARAEYDRYVLNHALDFAYNADLRTEAHFTGSVEAVRRSLDELRARKAGLQLPFLSDFYQWLVFDGLLLPDDKIAHLYRLFAGTEPPPLPEQSNFNLFRRDRSSRGGVTQWRTAAPPTANGAITLRSAEADGPVVVEGSVRAKVQLRIQNDSAAQGEFVGKVELPDGLLVSGFGLKIDGYVVPGKIFEKKAALWVYEMIRDRSRRDPGLLLFTGPHTLELRVFPVEARQMREVEIEFLYPAGWSPRVTIEKFETMLPAGTTENKEPGQVTLAELGDGAAGVLLTGEAHPPLPALSRTPYVHFIIERSRETPAEYDASMAMRQVLEAFPAASEYTVTVANFETRRAFAGIKPRADLPPKESLVPLPRRGGFAEENAVKRALFWYDGLNRADTNAEQWPGRFPLMVVLRSSRAEAMYDGSLAGMCDLVPDVDGYLSVTAAGAWEWHPWGFASKPLASDPRQVQFHSVTILRRGAAATAIAAATTKSHLAIVSGTRSLAPLTVLTALPKAWQPLAPTASLAVASPYCRGVDIWNEGRIEALNPALAANGLADLIARSRAERILIPASSFIVVENSAQWKMLSETEKKKLAANPALELKETVPEPGTALLLVLGVGYLGMRRARRPAKVVQTSNLANRIGARSRNSRAGGG